MCVFIIYFFKTYNQRCPSMYMNSDHQYKGRTHTHTMNVYCVPFVIGTFLRYNIKIIKWICCCLCTVHSVHSFCFCSNAAAAAAVAPACITADVRCNDQRYRWASSAFLNFFPLKLHHNDVIFIRFPTVKFHYNFICCVMCIRARIRKKRTHTNTRTHAFNLFYFPFVSHL